MIEAVELSDFLATFSIHKAKMRTLNGDRSKFDDFVLNADVNTCRSVLPLHKYFISSQDFTFQISSRQSKRERERIVISRINVNITDE